MCLTTTGTTPTHTSILSSNSQQLISEKPALVGDDLHEPYSAGCLKSHFHRERRWQIFGHRGHEEQTLHHVGELGPRHQLLPTSDACNVVSAESTSRTSCFTLSLPLVGTKIMEGPLAIVSVCSKQGYDAVHLASSRRPVAARARERRHHDDRCGATHAALRYGRAAHGRQTVGICKVQHGARLSSKFSSMDHLSYLCAVKRGLSVRPVWTVLGSVFAQAWAARVSGKTHCERPIIHYIDQNTFIHAMLQSSSRMRGTYMGVKKPYHYHQPPESIYSRYIA
ncbi:hypothetical protein C8Q76DRAFT_176239 [Earliella scabrosa]|nr:hypothetical protein C8Q76DRAFT_176239 [Earliella scabrosa]